MIETIKLTDYKIPNKLHDGIPHAIKSEDNKLILDFCDSFVQTAYDDNGRPYDIYPYKNFKAVYVLADYYRDDPYECVEIIDYTKILGKNALLYCTVDEAVNLIKRKKYSIEILHEAFNQEFCWLHCILYKKNGKRIGNINWQLAIKELIFEWENKE